MNKLPLFEDFIPMGFGVSPNTSFSISGSPQILTGYSMNAIVGPVMELGNRVASEAYAYEGDDNPDHKAESYIKEAKKHINKKIDEAYENYEPTNAAFESYVTIDEATDYEYDPPVHAERLKRREEQNIERYRKAQDRQDNYAIALYELKIKMDMIDLERLKVLTAIHSLKQKFNK